MTATEVLERTSEMMRVLGATYGRLQSELLVPLLRRAIHLLIRRGEISDLPFDGRIVTIEFRTPQTQYQAHQDATNTISWLSAIKELGTEAMSVVDQRAVARWIAQALGVPGELVRDETQAEIDSLLKQDKYVVEKAINMLHRD
jgi:hypothetical protein